MEGWGKVGMDVAGGGYRGQGLERGGGGQGGDGRSRRWV